MTFGDIEIKPVDAYNTEQGSSTRKVHHKGYGVGYLIGIGTNTIYHAGDTDFIPEMRGFGGIDGITSYWRNVYHGYQRGC